MDVVASHRHVSVVHVGPYPRLLLKAGSVCKVLKIMECLSAVVAGVAVVRLVLGGTACVRRLGERSAGSFIDPQLLGVAQAAKGRKQ